MSFLFGQDNSGPSPLVLAKTETEVLTDMFNRMSATCFKKCVVSYPDTELSVGEMACADRCVGKYLMAQAKVGDVLNEFEKQAKLREQATGRPM